MRFFPKEIEVYLLDRDIDIHDWWRRTRRKSGKLKLSSRRLLAVLELADEDSPFKNAFREDWSTEKYIRVSVLNELRLMRADNVAMHVEKEIPANLMKSPSQLRAEEVQTEYKFDIRSGIMRQLHAIQ